MDIQQPPTSQPSPPNPTQQCTYPTITYNDAKHIRYIQDFLCECPNPSYKDLDLDSLDNKKTKAVEYSSIPQRLYKKFGRDGYLQKSQQISKKSKRGGDQNYYNSSDPFIDDGLAYVERDVRESSLSDFKAFNGGLADFYKSLDYRPETIVEAKRKPQKATIDIPEEQRESIIRKLKNKQREQENRKQQE